jgi:hypothetical protein
LRTGREKGKKRRFPACGLSQNVKMYVVWFGGWWLVGPIKHQGAVGVNVQIKIFLLKSLPPPRSLRLNQRSLTEMEITGKVSRWYWS